VSGKLESSVPKTPNGESAAADSCSVWGAVSGRLLRWALVSANHFSRHATMPVAPLFNDDGAFFVTYNRAIQPPLRASVAGCCCCRDPRLDRDRAAGRGSGMAHCSGFQCWENVLIGGTNLTALGGNPIVAK
jgi:hypothetical protein